MEDVQKSSLKAGKDPSDSKSYRPISVLCPAIKILERLLLPILEQHLPNSNIQHGFHRGHSTTSALLELNSTISSSFNQKRPPCCTLLLQIDLSQAFDRVNHELLADLNFTPRCNSQVVQLLPQGPPITYSIPQLPLIFPQHTFCSPTRCCHIPKAI